MPDQEVPPYRCTYCLQSLPAGHRQHILAANYLSPKSDDANNFATEAQTIMRYIHAIASACTPAEQIDDEVVHELHHLLIDLALEGSRRLDRAQKALDIVWQREQTAQKASVMA